MANGTEKVLVVAGGAVDEGRLAQRLDLDAELEVKVVAPIETSDLDLVTGQVDASILEAEARAESAAAAVEAEGGAEVVETEAGEADPLQAIEDALATFAADQIVVVADSADPPDWAEAGFVDEVRDRFSLPVRALEA